MTDNLNYLKACDGMMKSDTDNAQACSASLALKKAQGSWTSDSCVYIFSINDVIINVWIF